MMKPDRIDPTRCSVKDFLPNDKDHNQIYKDIVHMDFWWGVLELAGGFDYVLFCTNNSEGIPYKIQRELSYIQLLHYTVFIKIAGAHLQLQNMQSYLRPDKIQNYSSEHRAFFMKECFDALHSDLYQSVTALANQLFILMNRSGYKPVKVDESKQISMSPSDVLYWLKLNRHQHFLAIKSILLKCERFLDIRHHLTHYGVIPMYRDPVSGDILLQKEFQMGRILNKYDLQEYHYGGGAMISAVEISEKRLEGLMDEIDNLYRHMFSSNMIEEYFNDRGISLTEAHRPYWIE